MPPISPAAQRLALVVAHAHAARPAAAKPTVPPRRSPLSGAVGVGGQHRRSRSCRSARGWCGRCARCHCVEGLDQQRRRAADEQAHVRARPRASSAGLGQQRTYSVGTPMNTVASGRRAITACGSKRSNQIILLPLSSAPCEATNRPCTWKIGSAWISTSSGAPAPVVLQRLRVAAAGCRGEHRALAAPGGAAGVEDGGQVVGRLRRGRVLVAAAGGALEQACRCGRRPA